MSDQKRIFITSEVIRSEASGRQLFNYSRVKCIIPTYNIYQTYQSCDRIPRPKHE